MISTNQMPRRVRYVRTLFFNGILKALCSMPLEEYNQLDIDYTHCAGSHYELTNAFIKQPMCCARKDKNQ